MKVRNALALSVAGGAVGVSLAWRFASRRYTLPCPHWLTLLLENPFMNAVAGSGAILNRLAVQPGMKLLDVGCGPGRITLPAAQRVGSTGEVVAVDIQPEMLQRVAQKAAAAHLTNIRLVQAGAGDGKLEASVFDRAWLVTVLGEIPDRIAALSEIFRALKPGGLLSITEVLLDPHYQTRSTVHRLAAQVGFEEQSSAGTLAAFTLQFAKPEQSTPKIRLHNLSSVSTTLLVPLYTRACESQRPDALIRDDKAAELVKQIDYNFAQFNGAVSGQIFQILRTREMDRRVRDFLTDHPDGTVVDIGCGLDTRFHRMDNGRVTWYDLDLPAVIAIRRQLIEETARCHFIGCSALDVSWLELLDVPKNRPVLFLAEGVFPYLAEDAIKHLIRALCERYPGSELVFDALPPSFRWISRFHPALRATKVQLGWTLADGAELEHGYAGIRLLGQWFYCDSPEPRLGFYRLLRWFPPIGQCRIVHYKLGMTTP